MREKFNSLLTLSCNYEIENVNLTLSEIYQALENQERKILQNTQEIKVMKEVLKNLEKLLPDTSEGKADIGLKSINRVELKQQEMLQLENRANRSQSVQTLPQTVRYSSNTKETILTASKRPSIKT